RQTRHFEQRLDVLPRPHEPEVSATLNRPFLAGDQGAEPGAVDEADLAEIEQDAARSPAQDSLELVRAVGQLLTGQIERPGDSAGAQRDVSGGNDDRDTADLSHGGLHAPPPARPGGRAAQRSNEGTIYGVAAGTGSPGSPGLRPADVGSPSRGFPR